MLMTILFCVVGLRSCQAGKGYNYPKPSVKFDDGACPPGSSGVFPNCMADLRPKCFIDWDQFKTTFNKTYENIEEEDRRQKIFLDNRKVIVEHNRLFDRGDEMFSLCINKFGDWTFDEYNQINGIDLSQTQLLDDEPETCTCDCSKCENSRLHSQMSEIEGENTKGEKSVFSTFSTGGKTNRDQSEDIGNTQVELPDSKDWRKEGAVTSVKDQLKCASCWSFSAAGALEGQFFLKNGVLKSLSEQQLIDCSRSYANNGCSTGFMTNAFLYTRKEGILTEEEYPYEAKDGKCRASANSSKNRRLKTIPVGQEEMLKEAVGKIGPVSVGLDATHDKFMFYSDGIYYNSDCNPDRISHAVLAVGYDTDEKTGLDYWIIKNSYGTSWGDGGYGKLARNKDNHCGIANLASYPII